MYHDCTITALHDIGHIIGVTEFQTGVIFVCDVTKKYYEMHLCKFIFFYLLKYNSEMKKWDQDTETRLNLVYACKPKNESDD